MHAKAKILAKSLFVFSILFLMLAFNGSAVAPSYAVSEEQEQQPATFFSDLPKTHWAYEFANKLYQLGITPEHPRKVLKPEDTITRAEFTRMLVRALGIAERTSDPPVFEDVPESAKYYGFVQAAAKDGIVVGGQGKFNPDIPITRQEMFIMLVNSLEVKNTTRSAGKSTFLDAGLIAPWIEAYVNKITEEGLVVGYPDRTLRPEVNATRAEAYTVIARLINKKPAPELATAHSLDEKAAPEIGYNIHQQLLQLTGKNMPQPGKYFLQIYDGKNNKVATIGIDVDSKGSFTTSYRFNGTEAEGNWRVDVAKQETPIQIEASRTFFVPLASIPEFPVGAAGAAVAGICAFIYYRMRKNKEALAA
ncbi:MAG: S-layer homology domain-containing protein [Bacillota bacterium]